MERAAEAINKVASNNTFLNVLLLGCFGTLSLRSMIQQNQISALETEKASISNSNKAIKKTIWDSKQHLFSEAEAAGDNAVIPLSKLKQIYGENTVLHGGDLQKGVEKSQVPKLLI